MWKVVWIIDSMSGGWEKVRFFSTEEKANDFLAQIQDAAALLETELARSLVLPVPVD